jgi:ferritin-like metal-binding protein YciE
MRVSSAKGGDAMPMQIGQIQQVLNKYNKQLRSRDRDSSSSGLSNIGSEVVTISTEGKQRGLLNRIGDDAVKSYKEQSYKDLKTAK